MGHASKVAQKVVVNAVLARLNELIRPLGKSEVGNA